MMDELMKAMQKKGGHEMSAEEKQAKIAVIQELLDMARDAMGEDVKSGLHGMQKVEVMAPNKEKLAEGLDVAGELVDKGPEALMDHSEEEETSKEESAESPEMEAAEEKAGVEEPVSSEEEYPEDEKEEDKKKSKKKPTFGNLL